MNMKMIRNSRTRYPFEVNPDVKPVRLERLFQQPLRPLNAAPQIQKACIVELRKIFDMQPGSYHHMAVIIRINIQQTDTVIRHKYHMIARRMLDRVAKNTGFFPITLHIFQPPRSPELISRHSQKPSSASISDGGWMSRVNTFSFMMEVKTSLQLR
jgi:hypothetical protein